MRDLKSEKHISNQSILLNPGPSPCVYMGAQICVLFLIRSISWRQEIGGIFEFSVTRSREGRAADCWYFGSKAAL